MGATYICPRCHSAVGIAGMRGDVCAMCAHVDRVAQEKAKTALADDLVRGVPSGDQQEDLK